jgi:hypothetical protein
MKRDGTPPSMKHPCMVCGVLLHAPFGRWTAGWTCSETCNKAHANVLRKAIHEKQLQVSGSSAKT